MSSVSQRLLPASVLVVAALALSAAPWTASAQANTANYCITSTSPVRAETLPWSASRCCNTGPNGEESGIQYSAQCSFGGTISESNGSSGTNAASGNSGSSQIQQVLGQVIQQLMQQSPSQMGTAGQCGSSLSGVTSATEGDPRYCSIVVLAPCPIIIKVGKNQFSGNCPDQAMALGGQVSGVGSQISGLIQNVMKGVVTNLVGSLMNGFGGGSGGDAAHTAGSTVTGTSSSDPYADAGSYSTGTNSSTDISQLLQDILNGTGGNGSSGTADPVSTGPGGSGTAVPTGGDAGAIGSDEGQAGSSGPADAGGMGSDSGIGDAVPPPQYFTSETGQSPASDAPTAQGGIVGNVCQSRPWAGGVIASVIPESFFDGLCSLWNGTAGPDAGSASQTQAFTPDVVVRGISCPAVARPDSPVRISWTCGPRATLSAVAGFTLSNRNLTSAMVTPDQASQVYGIECSDGFESLCTVDTIDPKVQLIASPSHVRVGSRTSLAWVSQDVQSCEVTGPSIDQADLYGNAQTGPITQPTTFTATCRTGAGDTVSSSVTVDFAQ